MGCASLSLTLTGYCVHVSILYFCIFSRLELHCIPLWGLPRIKVSLIHAGTPCIQHTGQGTKAKYKTFVCTPHAPFALLLQGAAPISPRLHQNLRKLFPWSPAQNSLITSPRLIIKFYREYVRKFIQTSFRV